VRHAHDAAHRGNDGIRLRPRADLVSQPADRSLLRVGYEELRRRGLVQAALERVTADSHDLDRTAGEDIAVSSICAGRESLADWILIRESGLGESSIDDPDSRRRCRVVGPERAARDDRDAEGLEEALADGVVSFAPAAVWIIRFAFRQETN